MAGAGPRPDVVLITGCSDGGIGAALVAAFHAKGCTVYASARQLQSMALVPKGVHTLRLDVCDDASIKAAVQLVVEEQGRIDILVNNAGIGQASPLAEADMEGAKQVYNTNVLGLLAVTQAVAPHMAERRSGKIINLGSIAGAVAMPLTGVYCSAKAAVHSLTDALRLELAPFNVQVMLLIPGMVQSNIWDKAVGGMDLARLKLYAQYTTGFQNWVEEAFNEPKTPTDVFAREVAAVVLRTRLPRQYWIGCNSSVIWLLSVLPGWLRNLLVTHRFGFLRRAETPRGKRE